MVFSRGDVKRRSKELQDPLGENPKRLKVQAQRKFAQGSGMNSPVKEMSLFKEKEKNSNKTTPDDPSQEVLPRNQPPTEDFLSFLCFRGTKYLTPRLNIFNEAPNSQRKSNSSTKTSSNSSSAQKSKATSSSPEQKKRSRSAGLQKGNAVRARTASNERQALKKTAIEQRQQLKRKKEAGRRVKPVVRAPHPSILKRLGASRLRSGLRSGGQLPPGSESGLKTDRKSKQQGRPKQLKRSMIKKTKMDIQRGKSKVNKEPAVAAEEDEGSELSCKEGEEEEEGADEEMRTGGGGGERVVETARRGRRRSEPLSLPASSAPSSSKSARTSRKSLRSRPLSTSPTHSPRKSRPTRRTKEAATLYMEMLTKDFKDPDEETEDEFIPDLPSSIKADKSAEENTEPPNNKKGGRHPKRRSSPPLKEENTKIRKLSKEKDKEDVEARDSSASRSKKPAPTASKKPLKGRVLLKSRLRPLRPRHLVKSSNPRRLNKSLRMRRQSGRLAKSPAENIISDIEKSEAESTVEGNDDQDMQEEENDSEKQKVGVRKNAAVTDNVRVTRNKKVEPEPKKRKNISEASSPSISEVSETESIDSRPKRTSGRKKSLKLSEKSDTDSKTSKRSLRSSKNESNISETVRRSKRNKDSDNDEDFVLRYSKYKEESDDDFEDEDGPKMAPKTRSSNRSRSGNKSETFGVPQKSLGESEDSDEEPELQSKKTRSSRTQNISSRGGSDYENDHSPEETVLRKTRGSVKNKSAAESDLAKTLVNDEVSDEEEKNARKSSGSRRKNVKVEEDSDPRSDEDFKKSVNKSSQKKYKNITDDSDEEMTKTSVKTKGKLPQRKTRAKRNDYVESDEEVIVSRNTRQRKSKHEKDAKDICDEDDDDDEYVKSSQNSRSGLHNKSKPEGDNFDTDEVLKKHNKISQNSGQKKGKVGDVEAAKTSETPDQISEDLPKSNQKARGVKKKIPIGEDEESGKGGTKSNRKAQPTAPLKSNKEGTSKFEEEVKTGFKSLGALQNRSIVESEKESDGETVKTARKTRLGGSLKKSKDNDKIEVDVHDVAENKAIPSEEEVLKDKTQTTAGKQKKSTKTDVGNFRLLTSKGNSRSCVKTTNDDMPNISQNKKIDETIIKKPTKQKKSDKSVENASLAEIKKETNSSKETESRVGTDLNKTSAASFEEPVKELKGRKTFPSMAVSDNKIDEGNLDVASTLVQFSESVLIDKQKRGPKVSTKGVGSKDEAKSEDFPDDIIKASQVSKIVQEIEMLASTIIKPSSEVNVKIEKVVVNPVSVTVSSITDVGIDKVKRAPEIKSETIEKKIEICLSSKPEQLSESKDSGKSVTKKEDNMTSSEFRKTSISRELPAKVVEKELPLRKPRKSFCDDLRESKMNSVELNIPRKAVKPFLHVEKKEEIREKPSFSLESTTILTVPQTRKDIINKVSRSDIIDIDITNKSDEIKRGKVNYEPKDLSIKSKDSERLKDLRTGAKPDTSMKRPTRLSLASPERDDKKDRRYDNFKSLDVDSDPPPVKSGRKPSLTARAQFINKTDETDKLPMKSNDRYRSPAPNKRKSHDDREISDSMASSSTAIESKVVEVQKASRKSKNPERRIDSSFSDSNFEQVREMNLSMKADINVPTVPDEKKMDSKDKDSGKPSIGDTWRQAFKNAKIPKPGHLSPVPHSVKPFVRQKLPNLSGTFQNKTVEEKPKTPTSLSPFKSLLANQSQGNSSPDRRNLSPAHKVNFGLESPIKKTEEVRGDVKKPETPVKTLTQLQYEKRSSEFISSYLEPSPPTALPAFESIRAFKKKEDAKPTVKSETPATATPPPEPAPKPSTEGKHLNLPLAVEHTLRKNSPITVSKKPPAKPVVNVPVDKRIDHPSQLVGKPVLPTVMLDPKIPALSPSAVVPQIENSSPAPVPTPQPVSAAPSTSHQSSGRDLLVREPSDLNALAKKKVNMTAEEINRWLNDSTSSGIEHKKDCGIFENNQCECSYRTSEASMQNSSNIVSKDDKIDHGVVEPPVQLRELDKNGKYTAETISTCKVEDYKEKILSKSSPPDNKMAPPNKPRRSSGHDRTAKSGKSMTEDEMCEYDFRFDRVTNSPRESVSDVSSHRDDASSSSEVPERKIFHQKRLGSKRPSLSSPTAFSVENESSIYAFKPDPTEKEPFRRGRGKSGDGEGPSSSSIAVQVNINNKGEIEAACGTGLECSTQTERPPEEGGQVFYIPLQDEVRSGLSGVPQGVAVKLDTEGPDQRVIMRAKLVTKPSSTFPSAASQASRGLLSGVGKSSSGGGGSGVAGGGGGRKPEQKVRPLWKAPVGKVQPTVRQQELQPPAPLPSQQHPQVQGCRATSTSQSTQVSTVSSSEPLKPPRSASTKAEKQPKSLALEKAAAGAAGGGGAGSAVEKAPPPEGEPGAAAPGSAGDPTALAPEPVPWTGASEFPTPGGPQSPSLLEAPTFYPTEKEFQEPLEYIEKITPLAQSFGICRIVPPASFKPECKVSDDMRFTAYNHYIHKLMDRWGPNVRELCAIKKYLTTQSINLNQLPLIGSMEMDLPRLYQTVQQLGGLKEVIEKKRWGRVADVMQIPKTAQDRLTKLDDIYCKYLLPYDTLSYEERSALLDSVEAEWKERKAKQEAGGGGTEEDGGEEEEDKESGSSESSEADDGLFECISKGKNMPLSGFFRTARNTMLMWFKEATPSAEEVEHEFWRHVTEKTHHVCVHAGSIDTGTWGCGFPTTKTSPTSRHPWNLKVFTNSPASILRSTGPIVGINVPTLHVGMLFSTCCWYRDPHALPWIEYLHTGASKIWYGVPDSGAAGLKAAVYPMLPRQIRDREVWLPSDLVMVPPRYLLSSGLSLCRLVQEPGQFILVFPKAFTSSISTGYVVSESVYFAQSSWLSTAPQVFKDMQDSSEPPVFSLHKLLFTIANDSKYSADILCQTLPMIESVVENEVSCRKKLEKLGLSSERIPSKSSRRKKQQEEEEESLECDTCRAMLFLSMVSNSKEDSNYCVEHALEILSKDSSQLKNYKLLVTYEVEAMEEVIDKLKSRIEMKSQKKDKKAASSNS